MPKKLILRDWNVIRQWLEPRLDDIQLISLDVFDTLLSRCIEPPTEVQRAVCRELAQYLGKSPDVVWQTRQAVELELRQQSLHKGADHECRYSQLVNVWLTRLTGRCEPAVKDFITRTELRLELLALHVKPEAKVFLEWAQEQKIRLVAVSDMYLDGHLLDVVLVRKGLRHYFDAVYVSADWGVGKYSGRLFQEMLKYQQVAANTVVHIGDNPVSDRRMACREGIQGIWLYEKAANQRREQQTLSAYMAQKGGIWTGRHFFECVQTRSQQQGSLNQQTFFFFFVRDVLGPAFSVFMQGLQERLQQHANNGQPIEKLFFVARDGFLFERMYQAAGGDIPAEYAYLSRKVITAAATAEGLSIEQARVAFYNPKQRGLESVCKVYGLSEEKLQPLALHHGFRHFAKPIQDWNDPRLQAFLQDRAVQAIIRRSGQQHRQLLERYLQQIGFFAQRKVAMVDIGWNGTIQRFLKEAFGHRSDFPVIHGYYFAFVPKMYSDFGADNFCEGILHDSRRGNACERIPAEFEEIFEQGARSWEGTTVGYQEVDGRIEPLLKAINTRDRQAELRSNPLVSRLQEGILHHWEHFRAIQTLTGYNSQQLLPYVHGLLERAIVYPTHEEIRELTQLVHTEDFGHDHVLDLKQPSLTWLDLLRPRHLWQRMRLATWRYALLDRLPTSLPNFACRIAYLHAVEK